MKNTPRKMVGCTLILLLLAYGSVTGQDTKASRLIGEWTNKDFATRDITRIQIRQEGGKFVVHAWGRCQPHECDWGDATADVNDAGLSVLWKQGFCVRTQVLSLLADGSLVVATQTAYTDDSTRPDRDTKDTFAKGLPHNWNDPAK